MRPISVLNVESRIYMSVVQKRLQEFMVRNKFVQTQVQKAFIDGVPGCIEHATVLMEALRDARAAKRSICVTWLDLANAYGSVRHMLVQFALEWYHVPRDFCEMMFHYYDRLFAYVQTKEWSSAWFSIGIGVPQGCTASTIVLMPLFTWFSTITPGGLGNGGCFSPCAMLMFESRSLLSLMTSR